ncbi:MULTISPECIES: SDR family oxidoreductase [Exiguobacterium]|uniref:SDR family NAD(P)-dependent oxidoreductase n=1 Tax=Exiguobacterium TaxID=33986 RepID=UPI000285E7DA|nr:MULTISPECIES: SDR family oxidoreductase [Exiguobacterium]AFS70071.1 short-chain dehydrogenase/reductase SDR [Exiguobacterium antarcticum B7]MCT4781352.1 SDR family oxidoreductase [Exiguobacterium soli]
MLRKTALITGASGGIGLDLAVLAARDGFDCVLIARNEKKLTELKHVLEKRYQIKAYTFAADLSQPDSVSHVLSYLEEHELTIDLLFNNAGFATSGRFAEIDPSEDINSIHVNVVALTELTKRLVPGMIDRGFGRILNVASVAAFMPGPYMSVYYATKAYVLSFSEALASELDGSGVTVTCLCPGPTDTNFFDRAQITLPFKSMPSHLVAFAGYRGTLKGKRVVVPGASNRAMVTFAKFLPRRLLTEVTGRIQNPDQQQQETPEEEAAFSS